MPRIAFIGAGSTVFARTLITDMLSFPALLDSEIVLMDIDPERLATSEKVAQKLAASSGGKATVKCTLDLDEAVRGADAVINMIQVGGYKPSTVIDFEIPQKYGLRQTIADTLGIGGIFRGLRTIPEVLKICRAMEKGCPNALFLNYTNPMAMLCWAVSKASPIQTVGLCHSVQGTAWELSRDIGVPVEEINYLCAGINHMAFYLKFERNGQDLYPAIRQVVAEGRVPDKNRVRYEMLGRLGYFVTESSEHFSEYCPHFIRRDQPELIERFNIPLNEYIRRCEVQIAGWNAMRDELESIESMPIKRSNEYGSSIVNSFITDAPCTIYGNVRNDGWIENLPSDACVEVPVVVTSSGFAPQKIGSLPPQLAAICMTNVNVQSLTVEAALTGKREHVYHAAMLDPHTAAELDLDKIWAMVDDLFVAHGDMIPPMR